MHYGLLLLLLSSLFSKKNRPLRGNKTMPSAEKQEWHSVKVSNESNESTLKATYRDAIRAIVGGHTGIATVDVEVP